MPESLPAEFLLAGEGGEPWSVTILLSASVSLTVFVFVFSRFHISDVVQHLFLCLAYFSWRNAFRFTHKVADGRTSLFV